MSGALYFRLLASRRAGGSSELDDGSPVEWVYQGDYVFNKYETSYLKYYVYIY